VTLLISVVVLDLMGKFSECSHIGGNVIGLVLNSSPATSQTTREPGLYFVINSFTRVAYFPHEISQLVQELIDLAILMLYPFPFGDVKVSAKGLTKTSSYEVEEAGPLAVWGILVEGNPLSMSRMAVDVWMYPLIPVLGWSFEEGNDESNLIHISSKGAPVIVKLRFYVIDESSQVLRISLKRLDIKLVWPFPATTLLQ
jgi:hypothetical protein